MSLLAEGLFLQPYAIDARNIMKSFGNRVVVNKVNLLIEGGETYGLLGPNGAGKTTLVKMLCGLLTPDQGEISVVNLHPTDKALSRLIGYMPQDLALYQNLTVSQNLQFFASILGLRGQAYRESEARVLELVGLDERRGDLVGRLSGGQKRRISLACALIHRPKLVFLDEPTVGVDPELRETFWNHFKQLQEQGVTFLITTHYMDEARKCNHIGFMRDGRLIASGEPKAILDETRTASLDDAFLEFSRRGERI